MAIGGEARSTFLAIVKGDASQAVSEFKKLGKSVETSTSGAQGSVGKFQSFTTKAMSEFKENAGMYVAGAGIAIGAFAIKAAGDFAALGVQVGAFSEASGLAYEDASRWIEVAGDLGIPVDALEKSVGKLNKSIDPQLFKDLGIEIEHTKTGATDVNGTFLNVIDKLNGIKDPAERAKTATKLLGRGWQDMAELIGMGSDSLKASLAGVSDQKVFDGSEVERARRYRDAMKNLQDKFEDLAIVIGEAVGPALTRAVEEATPLLDLVGTLGGKLADLQDFTDAQEGSFLGDVIQSAKNALNPIDLAKDAYEKFQVMTGDPEGHIKEGAIQAKAAAEEITYLGDANKEAAQKAYMHGVEEAALAEKTRSSAMAAQEASNAFQAYLGLLNEQQAFDNIQTNLDDMITNLGEGKTATDAQKLAIEEMFATTIGNGNLLASYNFKVAVDTGNLILAQKMIDDLRAQAAIGAHMYIHAGLIADASLRNAMEGRAGGGPVAANRPYMVGETGREMFVPSVSGNILNSTDTARLMAGATLNQSGSGGGTVNVYVTNNSADPNAVLTVIKQYARRGGVL